MTTAALGLVLLADQHQLVGLAQHRVRRTLDNVYHQPIRKLTRDAGILNPGKLHQFGTDLIPLTPTGHRDTVSVRLTGATTAKAEPKN